MKLLALVRKWCILRIIVFLLQNDAVRTIIINYLERCAESAAENIKKEFFWWRKENGEN